MLLTKKFDQLLCIDKMSNAPSTQDVCLICASFIHASVVCPHVDKSNCAIEQVNTTQEFPPHNNPYSNT